MKFGRVVLERDKHVNELTHTLAWLTGTPHSSVITFTIFRFHKLRRTNNHMISTVNSSKLLNNFSFKLPFNHTIFYL